MGLEVCLVELLPRLHRTGMGAIPDSRCVWYELVTGPRCTALEDELLCRPVGREVGFIESNMRVGTRQSVFSCSYR